MAAIITTQTPANQPNVPRSVQGPSSMPRISSTVHHQLTAARAKRRAMSPSRARAAANAGARPAVPGERSSTDVIKRSGGPRERRREAGLPLVLDAEGAYL